MRWGADEERPPCPMARPHGPIRWPHKGDEELAAPGVTWGDLRGRSSLPARQEPGEWGPQDIPGDPCPVCDGTGECG